MFSPKFKLISFFSFMSLIVICFIAIVVMAAKAVLAGNDPESFQKVSSPQSEIIDHDVTIQEAAQYEENFTKHLDFNTLYFRGYGVEFPVEDILEVAHQPGASKGQIRWSANPDGRFTITLSAVDKHGRLLPILKERAECCDVKSFQEIEVAVR